MIRRDRISSILLLPLLLLVAACLPAQLPGSGGGGTLTRAMTSEPVAIDPHGVANSGLNLVLPYLFDTLVTIQRDGKLVGLLAESWQVSPDGKAIDFKLKSGVTFHDGSKLDAAAVVFTFERLQEMGDKSPIAGNVKAVSRVEAIDESTVRFSFAQPTATFFSALAMPYAGIMSPAATKAAGDQIGLKPVGTGPFKLAEWKRGVSVTLVRNPDYRWGSPELKNRGPVQFERLVFKVIPDADTQLSALKAGDVDVIFVNEPSQVTRLEADEALQVERVDLDALIYLGYNCARPPFDEVKVRQAFSHAVDKAQVIEVALSGLGTRADTPLTPSMLGYDAALKAHGQDFDPDRSRALLAEAGFAQQADGTWTRDGKQLTARLLTSTRAPNDLIATVLQGRFKALGVPVEIQQLDSAAVMKATTEGSFDLLLWRYEWNDPDGLNIFLSSSRIRQTNRVFYSNKEVDALFARGQNEMDQAKRHAIYGEAQKIILAESPWQPLYTPVEAMVSRKRVKGLVVGALGRMLVNDVTLEGS